MGTVKKKEEAKSVQIAVIQKGGGLNWEEAVLRWKNGEIPCTTRDKGDYIEVWSIPPEIKAEKK